MKRRRRTLMFFSLCAGLVLAAMAWLTVQLVQLEKREARLQREKSFQESISLALYRMDSFLLPFLASESARPHLEYNSLFSPEQAYYLTQYSAGQSGSWAVACQGDLRVPSSLLLAEPEFCKLHFQVNVDAEDGAATLTSPRYPPNQENREFVTKTQNLTQQDLVTAAGLMERLKAMARPEKLVQLANAKQGGVRPVSRSASPDSTDDGFLVPYGDDVLTPKQSSQREMSQRKQYAAQALNTMQTQNIPISFDARDIDVGSFVAQWIPGGGPEPELLLLRSVIITRASGVEEVVQGIWVDWPKLKKSMLDQVKDLVPDASLKPALTNTDEPRKLASIPAVLHASMTPVAATTAVSPISATLYVAWAGVVAALIAVGFVVRAIIDLGERRGRFVSAVTHELRTPLTTFCLYSEMLADDMVRDEGAKREYLGTLKRESQRLAKIVENVLCYARLSEVKASANTERVDAAELVERLTPALARRTAEAGMQLDVQVDGVRGVLMEADPQTVERILMNLVDNACKYAKGSGIDGDVEDRRIHLWASVRNGTVEFRVLDHGPGIPRAYRRSIFKPFNRANASQHPTAPGLGLGLSLARGLARELGGDLRLGSLPEGFKHGAVMVLTAPIAAMQAVSSHPAPSPS